MKPRSGAITDGPSRAPARAMLKAVGFTDADLRKPIIGVANTWIEIGPCNYHLRTLAEHVKEGIRKAGGTPMEFNTVSISDGITMGSQGMKTSLISRDLIADSIELVARGNLFDGLIALSGCDKTIPGTIMALARLDIPGVMLYGGSIAPGEFHGKNITIQDVFEAVGAHAAGRMSDADLLSVENQACPGAGACGGQFTANTMSTVGEFLGISAMGFNDVPALDPEKAAHRPRGGRAGDGSAEAQRAAAADHHARRDRQRDRVGRRHRRLDQRGAAPARDRARGRRRAEHRRLRSHQREGAAAGRPEAQRPLRCDRYVQGRRRAADCEAAEGRRHSQERGADGDRARRSAKKPIAVNEPKDQEVVRPLSNPMSPNGGLAILRGNLAPEGAVVKIAGKKVLTFRGTARVFDTEEAAFEAVDKNRIKAGDVLVIRYEGPKGGPGMREMLAVTGALQGQGLGRTGRAADRRPILRRDARPDGRTRRARSRGRRTDCRRARWRHDRVRHSEPAAAGRVERRGNCEADVGLESAGGAVRDRCDGEIREAGVVGVAGSGDELAEL